MTQLGSDRSDQMIKSFVNNFCALMADKNVHGLACFKLGKNQNFVFRHRAFGSAAINQVSTYIYLGHVCL